MNFEQALRLDGLRPLTIIADGKRRRCSTDDKPKKKNGQYVLLLDGVTGFWRNFAVSTEWSVWKDSEVIRARPVDPAKLQAHRAMARAERVRGIEFARKLWEQGQPYRGHPYLESKGLAAEGCIGLKTWEGEVWVDDAKIRDKWLLVPLWHGDKLMNVQRISSNGVKRQIKGAPQIGCCHSIVRRSSAITVIVEGLATGLAVYQAVRNSSVHVAFYVDNLIPLIERIRPTGNVVFAADNDHTTMKARGFNPGIEKATNAASLIGAGVAYPKGILGTDWADARKEWGLAGIKRIEREILAASRFVMPP